MSEKHLCDDIHDVTDKIGLQTHELCCLFAALQNASSHRMQRIFHFLQNNDRGCLQGDALAHRCICCFGFGESTLKKRNGRSALLRGVCDRDYG